MSLAALLSVARQNICRDDIRQATLESLSVEFAKAVLQSVYVEKRAEEPLGVWS